MSRDIAQLLEGYLSGDPRNRAKLASEVEWRRLQLLALREILLELRSLNETIVRWREELRQSPARPSGSGDISR